MLCKFGACASPTTSARYIRKNLAVLKADQDEALRRLPDDWILVAATDNAGKQQGSTFVNTLQIFLWSFAPTASTADLPEKSKSLGAPPQISEKDEEEFARTNPIYGDAAITEELGNIEGKVTTYNGGASAVVQRAPEAARCGTMQHPNGH